MDKARGQAYKDILGHMDSQFGKPSFMSGIKKKGQIDPEAIEKGKMVEMEHTEDEAEAEKIAMDHLREDPEYYDKLEGMEEGETPEQEEEENEEEEGEDEEEKGSEKPMFSLSELVRKKGGEEEPALKIEIKKKGKMR